MKKAILYIFVFVASLFVGNFAYEKPQSPGVFEKYIFKDPTDEKVEYQDKAPMPEEGRVNINTATAYQLTALPNIGSALAGRIVSYRKDFGEFEVKEDLLRVPGIGEKTFEKIKDLILIK